MTSGGQDPEIITSKHSGYVTKDDVTVELCIYRLADTKWTLEVVDAEGTSTVWDARCCRGRRIDVQRRRFDRAGPRTWILRLRSDRCPRSGKTWL